MRDRIRTGLHARIRARSSAALLLGFALIIAATACDGRAAAPADGARVAERGTKAPAPDGAMCGEHGVLQSICTKCNPKLIPVFQAKGDWCAEHGLPESVCPICHPERGGKPSTDVTDDGAPADGTKVRLKSKDTARLAGLATVIAQARPGGAQLAVVATIGYDATRRAEINARSAGVVRALRVDVGARVAAGAPLAEIDSAAVGADRSRLLAAASRVQIAEAHRRREQELLDKGISSRREVLDAERELSAAQGEHAAAVAALGVVGKRGGGSGYVLAAPIAGTVIRRTATVGHMVDLEEVLFEIVDTSTMWAEIEVPETELEHVGAGQAVSIVVDGAGAQPFVGTIAYVAPEIDPQTRTAKARVALANPDGKLRANMFGRARITLGAERQAVVVPLAAVQRVGAVALCFVRVADEVYETRRVQLGATADGGVEVVAGVVAGEAVVTEGSFLLKTETLKGSIGAGCCE